MSGRKDRRPQLEVTASRLRISARCIARLRRLTGHRLPSLTLHLGFLKGRPVVLFSTQEISFCGWRSPCLCPVPSTVVPGTSSSESPEGCSKSTGLKGSSLLLPVHCHPSLLSALPQNWWSTQCPQSWFLPSLVTPPPSQQLQSSQTCPSSPSPTYGGSPRVASECLYSLLCLFILQPQP